MIATAKDPLAQKLLPIVMLTVGINYEQNPICRPDGAIFHQIFYVESGEGVLVTPEGSFDLTPGMAVFMRRDVPVEYYGMDHTFESAWVTFNGVGVDSILEYLGAENFAFLKSRSVYPMIVNAYKLADRGASPELLSRCAYDVLTAFFHELNTEHRSPILIRAKDYIEEHYNENISVSDLARELGISESLLFRLFREGERQTPSDCLRNVRIRRAEQLLLSQPDLKITELALRCGFSDAAYFCKVFKNETGMTPKTYQSRFVQ